MLADIDKGKIDCIVCKDLSRLGRNSIDTGYYIEKHFPLRNVRFIAVTDSFDSATDLEGSNGIMLGLKNMINEAYSMDIGKKIKAQQQQAIKDGQFVGARPPYGYLKSPNDCHKLIINEETAPIVRRIFEMAAGGMGLTAICKVLNEDGVLTPSKYAYSKGISTNSHIGGGVWQTRTITVILNSEMYIGNMMQGKSDSINRKQTRRDKSEWVIIPNTHEPIVSRELFDTVQKVRAKMTVKHEGNWTENVFKGKIFCGHCGKNLHRQKVTQAIAGDIYFFHCISRNRIAKDYCDSHIHIKEDDLIATVFHIIERQSKIIYGRSLKLAQKQSQVDIDLQKKSDELSKVAKELAQAQKYLKGLYENLASGILDLAQYKALKQGYEGKIEILRSQYIEIETQIKSLKKEIVDFHTLNSELKTLSKNTDLSRAMVERLIDKIVVHDNSNIDIFFTFDNAFPLVKEVLCNG